MDIKRSQFSLTSEDKLKGAIIGAIVGDALGVPFEFLNPEKIYKKRVKSMYHGGYHNQPSGTWSDDSSLILCTLDSLSNGYDLKDIGNKFKDWLYLSKYTPYGIVFDCGNTISQSIHLINKGIFTGLNSENNCGNGSLMRIIPLLFIMNNNMEKRFEIIKDVSSLTHSHIRCIIACNIYMEYALNLILYGDKYEAYEKMRLTIKDVFKEYKSELEVFSRILDNDIGKYPQSSFNGKGYVVNTLEISLYSFLTTDNYADSVIKAILFGYDTDTNACVTGGLSGLYYGLNNIPKKWIDKLAKVDEIYELLNNSYKKIIKNKFHF